MKTFKQHMLSESAFTKQHYDAVAAIISRAFKRALNGDYERLNADGSSEAIDDIAEELAELFKKDNPRFDKGFFLTRCGI